MEPIDANQLAAAAAAAGGGGGGGGGGSVEQMQAAQAQAEMERERRQVILDQILEDDASARLSRVKLVRPQQATALEDALIQQAMSGKLPGKVTESQLIAMLEGEEKRSNARGKVTIQRRRYADDSDDDDNDDDLL